MADEKQTPPPEDPPPDHGTPPSAPTPESPAAPDPEPDPDAPGPAGPLTDDAKALFEAVRDGIAAYAIGLRAFKRLFVAEAVLARDAVVIGLVFLLLSMIGFGTAFALLTGLVVWLLIWSGVPVVLSILLPLVVCGFLGWLTMRRARAAFRYADFAGTIRQFDRGLAPKPDDPQNPTPERASHPAETNA
jgi:hypothetical protein